MVSFRDFPRGLNVIKTKRILALAVVLHILCSLMTQTLGAGRDPVRKLLSWNSFSAKVGNAVGIGCSQDHDSWLSPTAPRPHASRGPQLRRHEITPARRRTNESGTSAGQCVVRPLPALNGTNVTRTAPRTPTPKHTRVHPGLSRRLGRTPRKQVEDICRTFSRLRLQADSEAECHAPRSRSDVASKPTRKRPPTSLETTSHRLEVVPGKDWASRLLNSHKILTDPWSLRWFVQG
ncbi:uncharacterized protein PGTG_15798 [Puccinia graminis f. sp. tritici CRL 75-36-700-3]|uniref:Uncharacterized protein n=1 Tax=Puccinia graminis f. sp. tritici (strain CRL 75-36-700-3 / race SCCL) TaxID=418459 RepID=E3KZW1_PUCGT|nr:uncharacterized protein PGTG_15798 [Puccinia graminis f. sp. tritici CRL 75-36-700-3]EFP89842.2 hypothetical protein PGTG_15798 [Puccinia graminis f. sp. tritici CRL 75-36-700-3]